MQFRVLQIGIDCHHQIPISSVSHQICLFQFIIYLLEPRLSEGGHILEVCLTSLGCMVAVYVVLVFAGGHNLVMIPKNGRRGLQDLSLLGKILLYKMLCRRW